MRSSTPISCPICVIWWKPFRVRRLCLIMWPLRLGCLALGGLGATSTERDKIKEKWYAGLTRLAQSKHVMIKLSGLFMPIVGWNYEQKISVNQVVDLIGPHIQFAIDTFGVDRCMFATNFPPDHVAISFETYYDAYFKIVEGLSMEAKRKLFHDNAARFYRIDEQAGR